MKRRGVRRSDDPAMITQYITCQIFLKILRNFCVLSCENKVVKLQLSRVLSFFSLLSSVQHNTTSSKGFLSPGSRSPKFKSSKKCLVRSDLIFMQLFFFHVQSGDLYLTAFEIYCKIAEMAKESGVCPTESVYPALVNCVAPVDIILPQITSNMW